jgi:type I restriction enzyme S subunit
MGTLCSIDSGSSNAQDAIDDAPYVLFDRSKTIKRSTRYLFDCEALIIPGEGTEFLPRHFIGKFDLHQRAYALHNFSEEIDVRYLYYYLIHFKDYFPAVAVGATVKSLRRRHFENLPVTVAPLAEQKRIVAILDEAFVGLAAANAIAEKNYKNAGQLFGSYLSFTLTQAGAAWEKKKLPDVAREFGRGKSKHRPRNDPKLYGGPYPFVQTGDISNADHWLTDYTQTYSELGLAQSRRWPKGTICIAIVGATVGETAILDFEACFPDSVIGIVVDEENVDAEYVEYLLQAFKAVLKEKGKGTARDNINLGTFESQLFPFPAREEQRLIVDRLNEMASRKRALEEFYTRRLAAISELRQSILRSAFAGELTSPLSEAIRQAAE